MLEVLYQHAKFGGARISPAAGSAKNDEFFVCLSVRLSVRDAFELNVIDCTPDFATKALEYRNDFDTVGYGKVRSCAPVFNFVRLLPIGDTTKCRSPKYGKIWQKLIGGFSPPEDDRINRSRRNFAGKRIPWVCYSTLNLALISKRKSVQEPRKMSKFVQKCSFWPPEADTMNTFR